MCDKTTKNNSKLDAIEEVCSSILSRSHKRFSCSSIATKVNTKLFSKLTKARTWDIKLGDVQGGIPWIDQAPTMVMGLSLTKAGGSDAKTVVVGSVSLNGRGEAGTIQIAQDVRIQDAAGVVTHENMLRLTKVSDWVRPSIKQSKQSEMYSSLSTRL